MEGNKPEKRGTKRKDARLSLEGTDARVNAVNESRATVKRVCTPADNRVMEELIEDPVNEEKERRSRAFEKWTEESHQKFIRRLVVHGKKFNKVADHLPEMTVADCVEHYYMTKPFDFNFEKWQAREKAKDDGLKPSSIESKGTSTEAAQASTTSEPH
ncbi:nuclear receptor corepressor 1-like [Pocillopora verrucosa]|uniref:nuclear receptor corepressor 1-like n=1 Tax=Pocillopora verrucosa TaxID=203993 RepID=UPI003342DF5C